MEKFFTKSKKDILCNRRVLLLTALERSFYSTIIDNYLFNPALELSERCKNGKFFYLGFIPLTMYSDKHRTFQKVVEYYNRRKKVARRFSSSGIGSVFLPILFTSRFYLTSMWFILFLLETLPLIFIITFIWNIRLIHARSYPATLIAWVLKKIRNIEYIFDMRGLYPEHGYENHRLNREGYKFWKRIERRLIRDSKIVISVSEPMVEHIHKIVPGSNTNLIPLFVDNERFHPNKGSTIKDVYGIGDRFVILHSGSFGTWGDHRLISKLFYIMKEMDSSVFLVMLTGRKDYAYNINKDFVDDNLKDYLILSPHPEDVPRMLHLGDAGLLLEREFLTQKVCLSVKFGEYIASGLPVIATPYVEGAKRLINRYKCGAIIDPDDTPSAREKIRDFLDEYNTLRKNALNLADTYLNKDRWTDSYCSLWCEEDVTIKNDNR